MGGQISFQEAIHIMMLVMDALREVHKCGIIHRDISPDNNDITKGKKYNGFDVSCIGIIIF